jgi:hypothetical protein
LQQKIKPGGTDVYLHVQFVYTLGRLMRIPSEIHFYAYYVILHIT